MTHILHVFPSFAAGGAQMRMAALANHFGPSFTHSIIALDNDTSCRDRLDPSLAVTFPPAPAMRASLPTRLRRIAASLATLSPDLLITSNWGSIEWAIANRIRTRIRHIHTEDGFGRDEQDRQLPRRVLTRRLILRAGTTVVPSKTLLDAATAIWRLPPTRLHYIPNGIDLARFHPGTPPARPVIGCVAALRPEKNLARLIRACAIVRQTHDVDLAIAGDGPERPSLEALAATLSVPVRFLGALSDPAPFYRTLTLFALSSDTEQMPLSVMEAMASALPIVATDVGDIASMVTPANRPYLTPRDDQSLATALATLLDTPETAQAIGQSNRQQAEANFDFAAMASAWQTLTNPLFFPLPRWGRAGVGVDNSPTHRR